MEFTVPQFIERETKIVGPFTIKQLVLLAAAVGISFFFFAMKIFPVQVWVVVSIILVGGTLALIFLKINGVPLPIFIKNFFSFLFKTKIYVWKKKDSAVAIRPTPEKISKIEKAETEKSPLKLVEKSRLKDLTSFIETRNK